MVKAVHEIIVYLEDTKKVKEMQREITDLKLQVAKAEAKALKFHNSLIDEMSRSIRLEDKVRELERILHTH